MAGGVETRPMKRIKLLEDEESDSPLGSISTNDFQSPLNGELSINQDYAKRFEHNKKRDELSRLEERYGKSQPKTTSSSATASEEDSDSSDEEEDEGDQATEQVDDQIFATLQAIREKDPRIYDKGHTFYDQTNPDTRRSTVKDQPLSLQAYHRQNLLRGASNEDDEDATLPTYAEEQTALRQDMIQQMHGAGDENGGEVNDADTEEEFLQAKPRTEPIMKPRETPAVSAADGDPEAFLSELMASRAWAPKGDIQLHPFESDDEEEDVAADKFEEAYNMRFEDPAGANETLRSHSRKAAEEFSVRREQSKGRKRAREVEKSRKEMERQEREDDKTRLRNLRIEQTHKKLQQLKEAAGLRNADLPVERWSKFLEAAFDSEKWDEEFEQRFGEEYYAEGDGPSSADEAGQGAKRVRKAKKPQWEDDIDIGDIVPDFEAGEDAQFSLSEDDAASADGNTRAMEDGQGTHSERPAVVSGTNGLKKKNKLERAERKRNARREHRKVEEMVDSNLPTEMLPQHSSTKRPSAAFRYRATSPTAFGLSARDILFAEDRELNQHHGLKKLAAFRDQGRKQKDKRNLDKKKLQRWRKETFGDRHGPTSSFQDYVRAKMDPHADITATITGAAISKQDNEGSKKKRKRPKKAKTTSSAAS